jgi:hypothetical protein
MIDRLLRGPAKTDPIGPYAYADVPTGIPPSQLVLLDNGLYVRRSKEGILVPAWVVDSSLTLMEHLDGSNYTAGSPPTGWAETEGTDGSISVVDSKIRLYQEAGDTTSLVYTFEDTISSDDWIVIIGTIECTNPAENSTDRCVLFSRDDERSRHVYMQFDRNTTHLCYWAGTVSSGSKTALSGEYTFFIAFDPTPSATEAGACSYMEIMDRSYRYGSHVRADAWFSSGQPAQQLDMRVAAAAGTSGAAVMDITDLYIYYGEI